MGRSAEELRHPALNGLGVWAAGAGTVDVRHLTIRPARQSPRDRATAEISRDLPEGVTMPAWLQTESARVKKWLIEQTLRSSGGVQTVAAARLGLDPRTLYTKMHKYGIREWRL
jgi:DNA-binding NtrC family response regulator